MRFTIEGREYDFDRKMEVEEAMVFQDKAGLGMNEIDEALNRGNPYVTVTLIYLAKKRAGEAVRWQDLMKLDLNTFKVLPPQPDPGDEGDVPGVPEQRADPTLPDGTTQSGDTTATS
jgi:hypothetical protein